MTSSSPARRRVHLTAGLVTGVVLSVAVPLAASAHVHVSPEHSAAGTPTRLDFSFSHGCDGAATTALVFDIPDRIDGVTPVLDGAWSIDRELGDNGIPTRVTFTAVTPVDDGVSATVGLTVIFASAAAGTDVAFPVRQECGDRATDWSDVATPAADAAEPESPAPVVAVGDVSDQDGDGHAGDHGTEQADPDGEAHASPAAADPVARWLAGGALVAALAALGTALLRRRR